MSNYVDGFILPIATRKLAAYRRMAKKASSIWREHGALATPARPRWFCLLSVRHQCELLDLCRGTYYQAASIVLLNRQPKSVNDVLSILRLFFRFLHLRGECSPTVALAVPTVADFGRQRVPAILDDQQRRKFLAAFNRKSDEGRRDYAMAVCLIDLGLRAIEVSRLRVADINGSSKVLTVPAAKASAGRQLP